MTPHSTPRATTTCLRALALLACCYCDGAYDVAARADERTVRFTRGEDRLDIDIGGNRVAMYVMRDKGILRPYFTAVSTASGRQVTRNHPPKEGADPTDHAAMHPGLWVAFGDMGGEDFWRNQGRVVHRRFVEEPKSDGQHGSFVAENEYIARDGRTLCRERCRWTIVAQVDSQPAAWWLLYDGSFAAAVDGLAFGDQEEMGIGVRLATPLTVAKGGEIRDSAGRTNEQAVWGRQADWCDYGGTIDGRRVGLAIVPHVENFTKSWFHVRDYGLMVANPFGRNAFTGGEKSRVEVAREPLRLRWAVFVYDVPADERPDVAAAYRKAQAAAAANQRL